MKIGASQISVGVPHFSKNKKILAFLLLFLLPAISVHAYWVWSPEQGKFVNAEGVSQDTAQDDFDYAMKFYREKNLEEAQKRFKDILKKYPQSRVAPEAQYRLGLVLEEKGDYLKAYKAYKRLVESYPQSERFNEVIEREFRIGNIFLSGRKAKFAGFEILPSLPKAIDIFQHITKNAPYSDFGDKAQFQLGLALKQAHRFSEAMEAFQTVLDQYPKSELFSQARYELAESSFLRSASNVRDQRSLDDASKQVNKYLDAYPQGDVSEKAAKIRQEIDEKNAEKNFRIGLYYEKDNYVESAIIYYQDVAARYPDTQWGQKAAQKIKTLKEPAKYIKEQANVLQEQAQALETKLKTLETQGADPLERDITKRSLERVQKHQKTLEKDKKHSLETRKQDLARRERELKQKFKNLDQKRKLLSKNKSEDLKKAIERWNASLISEQEELAQERQQLEGWREDLGVRDKTLDMSFLPFVGEPVSEIQKVQAIEAKKFYKLSEEKKSLLEEKETLYKHHSEVSSLLTGKNEVTPAETAAQSAKLNAIQSQVDGLEKELEEKTRVYEKQYGKSTLASLAGGVKHSIDRSLEILNPFDNKSEVGNEQKLLERQMHLKERLAAQEALVQTLSRAFDSQMALQEQKRLMQSLQNKEKKDPRELRKTIRDLERKIRAGYEEIESRDKNKKKAVEELDVALKQREKQAGFLSEVTGKALAPAKGTVQFVRSFFFGLPHKDVEVTKTAEHLAAAPDTERIKELESEIKNESLMIEAKNREIINYRKELEILKAQASLSGGYKFRSVFVDIPYLFYNEAMDSAHRIIPKKNREEVLINRLNDETQKLEKLKTDLAGLEKQIGNLGIKSKEATASDPTKLKVSQDAQEKAAVSEAKMEASQEKMRREITDLHEKLQAQAARLREEREINRQAAPNSDTSVVTLNAKQTKKLHKELDEIEDNLKDLIQKEGKLESEETQILQKRIHHIDKTMKKVHSKAVSQDLLTEKERMETRLSQIESRKDFLSQEMKRFESVADAAKPRA